MNITFYYNIVEIVKAPSLNGLQDVVTKVGFTYTGELEDGTKITEPKRYTDVGEADPENFKPISELSEEDVIEWVKASYPIGPVTEMITKQLNDIVSPKEVVTDLPWAPPAPLEPTGSLETPPTGSIVQ